MGFVDPIGLEPKNPEPPPDLKCSRNPTWADLLGRVLAAATAAEIIHTGEIVAAGGIGISGTGVGAAVGIPLALLGTGISLGGLALALDATGLFPLGIFPPTCQ